MLKTLKIGHGIVLAGISLLVFAEPEDRLDAPKDTIKITVTIQDETAAGLGYLVEGRKYGGSGKVFSGEGPKGKEYSFGFRKKYRTSTHIQCGKLTLDKDSNISLITEGDTCHSKIEEID